MAKCYIDFTCNQQELTLPNPPVVAEGAANVLYARFDLCPKWDGLALYARFKHLAAVYDVPISEGCALIPWEVTKYTGFEVSIFGEDAEGGRLTSAKVFVDVKRGIDYDGAQPIPATPTLLQRFEADVAASAKSAQMAQEANAATVAVGSVVTGEAGTDASVNNSGTGMAAVLDFTIPRGEKGEKGDGMPEGGTAGQVMTKTESGVAWADAPESGTPVDFPILVNQGGTGATNAEAARANLDVYGKSDVYSKAEVYTKAEVDALNIGGGGSGGGFVEHEHSADDITSGLLPIAYGGTGANTAAGAREALGITRENLGVTLENLGAADYIVAEGTTGIWEWRKWASGKAECCCRINFANLTCDKEWDGMYYTAGQYVGDYPFAFTKTPAIFTNLIGGRDGITVLNGYGNTTQPPKVYLLRPDKITTAFDLACSFMAEGRWK